MVARRTTFVHFCLLCQPNAGEAQRTMGAKILLPILLLAFQFSAVSADCNATDFRAAIASATNDQGIKAICAVPDDKRDKLPDCVKDSLSKYSVKDMKNEGQNGLETLNKLDSFNTLDALTDKLQKDTPELTKLLKCSKDEVLNFIDKKSDEIMAKVQLPQTKEFLKQWKQSIKGIANEGAENVKKAWKDLEPSTKQDMVDAVSFSSPTAKKILANNKVQEVLGTKPPNN